MAVISMLTALTLIITILSMGGFKTYFRRKYDVTKHLERVQHAADRNKNARVLHVQTK